MLRAPLQPATPTPRDPLPPSVPHRSPTGVPPPPGTSPASAELVGHDSRESRLKKNVIYIKTNPMASCTPGGKTDSLDRHMPTAWPIALPGHQPGTTVPPWTSPQAAGARGGGGCPGRGRVGALRRRCGMGAGGGSVPRRSSWARHVPAFTPRVPAGCPANSGTGAFALAAAQQRPWGEGEASAGAAAERARPWGASWSSSGTP